MFIFQLSSLGHFLKIESFNVAALLLGLLFLASGLPETDVWVRFSCSVSLVIGLWPKFTLHLVGFCVNVFFSLALSFCISVLQRI